MSNSFLIESYLMRSIIEKILPDGLATDDKISQMTEDEKKELYQKQKLIIQEFQKRSDQEIMPHTSVLRNLNENLLSIRKNQMINDINANPSDNNDEIHSLEEKKVYKNHVHSPPRLLKSIRSPISLKKHSSINVLIQKKSLSKYRPPFRH